MRDRARSGEEETVRKLEENEKMREAVSSFEAECA